MTLGIWIAAFLIGCVLDVVWVRTVAAVQHRRAFAAANLSVVLYLCSLVSTVLVVQQCIGACVAFAAGSWLGTFLSVQRRLK
jgi:hypothetical protein